LFIEILRCLFAYDYLSSIIWQTITAEITNRIDANGIVLARIRITVVDDCFAGGAGVTI